MTARAARTLPTDEAIYRHYASELRAGRGAYARTARAMACSDELVRKVVKRHEAKRPAPVDALASLAYEPAPGELDYQAACRANAERLANKALLTALLLPTPAQPERDIIAPPELAPPSLATPQSDRWQQLERKPDRYHVDRDCQQAFVFCWWLAAGVTACAVLLMWADPRLGATVGAVTLGLWRAVERHGRILRNGG